MKKQTIAALAILGATMGMGATPTSVPQQSQQQQQKNNEAVERTPTTVRQGRATSLNPTGGTIEWMKEGRSPKEYGQWLQQTGRQKWIRRK